MAIKPLYLCDLWIAEAEKGYVIGVGDIEIITVNIDSQAGKNGSKQYAHEIKWALDRLKQDRSTEKV